MCEQPGPTSRQRFGPFSCFLDEQDRQSDDLGEKSRAGIEDRRRRGIEDRRVRRVPGMMHDDGRVRDSGLGYDMYKRFT